MKIKIAFISHEAKVSGAPKTVLETVLGLSAQKFDSVLVFPENGSIVENFYNFSSVYVIPRNFRYRIPRNLDQFKQACKGFFSVVSYIRVVSKLLRKENVTLVHVNTLIEIPGSIAAIFAGKPIVWQVHEIPQNKLKRTLATAWVSLVSKKVIAVSNAVARTIPSKRKTEIIYNGIDIEAFDRVYHSSVDDDIKNFLEGWSETILFVGSITKEKGIRDFLNMAKNVSNERQDIGFLIVGSPNEKEYLDEMKSYSEKIGLNNRIFFSGFRKNIPAIMRMVNVFVLSSIVEDAFPWTILEAMASGKPVVATDVGGVREMIKDGITGILVPVSNVTRLSDAVLSLIDKPDLSQKMGTEGRKRLENCFTRQMYLNKVEQIYCELALKSKENCK